MATGRAAAARLPSPVTQGSAACHSFPPGPGPMRKPWPTLLIIGDPTIYDLANQAHTLFGSMAASIPDVLQVQRLSADATIPTRGSKYAAGYDLYASKDMQILKGGRAVVPTDITIAVPPSTYGRVAPRSGLAVKHGINTGAGVIDEDYRGPVGVVLFNHGEQDFQVKKGDRIAQLVIERIVTPEV